MSDQPDLARRGLLTGAALTQEGRKGIERQLQPSGPLPPWHAASHDDCRVCEDTCVSSCPEQIIRLHPETHGLAATPYLDFKLTGCTFCGQCAEHCPHTTTTAGALPRIGTGISLDKNVCLAWNGVFCMSCIGHCELRVLQLNEYRQLLASLDDCTGCGMCIHVCPVSALTIDA